MGVRRLSDGAETWSPDRRQDDQKPLTLGDLVDAVLRYAADSREAAVVIEVLLTSGRVRMTTRGPSHSGPVA